MKFINGFGKGVAAFFSSLPFIFEKGLWHYLFYPLILWLLMWVAAIYAVGEFADWLKDWISAQLSLTSIPDSGHWLSWAKGFITGYLGFIIAWLVKIILWLISGTFMKYVILILLSPVFALLSESTEEKITGKKFPFSFSQLMKDILRGVAINLRNMVIELTLITIGFLICLPLPFLFVIVTPFLMFIGWYYIGFAMLDYSCERNKMGVRQSIRFVRENKGLACGIGFCYAFIMAIPFLGPIAMSFCPVLAVAGATTSFITIKQSQQNYAVAV
jgi:CysZ protein